MAARHGILNIAVSVSVKGNSDVGIDGRCQRNPKYGEERVACMSCREVKKMFATCKCTRMFMHQNINNCYT